MILTEVEKQGVKVGIGRLERLVAVQGFGRPAALKGHNIKETSFPEAWPRASPRSLRI